MPENKKYYWLKLKNDFFTTKEMKKLRKIAGGDTYTIIYLKLQLLSLKDEGRLYFDGLEDSFADELALILDEEPENVQATMLFLEKCGLLEYETDNDIVLTAVPYLIGSETEKAELMRKSRARKKALLEGGNNVTGTLPVVTDSYPEKEKEKEKEKDIESRDRINYQMIVDMYNETCVSFPSVRSLSDSRKKAIRARLNTYTVDDFKELFRKAEASPFLKGGNNRNWSATFDWLIKDSNMAKVLEGNYDDRSAVHTSGAAADLQQSYNMLSRWAADTEEGTE